MIAGIQAATSSAHASDVKAWEEELVPCEHTRNLEQPGGLRELQLGAGAKCAKCDLTSNLWLCLTCGHLGCGRAQFGGVSGNSHGLSHFEESGHPCSVKQGTITAEGTADLYCYACNDSRLDPLLGDHLKHFGLNVMQMSKTEKSMTELQLEQNAKFDFSMTGGDGKELEPVYGPQHTGIQNLGNSCYLASVLQALFAMPEFQERFGKHFRQHVEACRQSSAAECLECQFGKLADGLLSGRYAKPRTPPPGQEEGSSQLFQEGIRPTMFKALVGRGNAEFATMRQQDADEFLNYLVSVLQAEQKRIHARPDGISEPLADPTRIFAYTLEHRLQCTECQRVRYTTETQDVGLGLPVPVRRREAGEDDVPFERVSLRESLDLFTRAEQLEYRCPACQKDVLATKQTLFATFPQVLAIQAQRFQLINWVPQKVDVPFEVPLDEDLDLSAYLGHGIQPGEETLPDDAPEAAGASSVPDVDPETVMMLTSMGFSENRAKRALIATGASNAEVAANWLFEHMDEDLDGPLEPSAPAKQGVDTTSLEDMGFSKAQATKALRLNQGNPELAVAWLFDNPEDPGEEEPPAEAGADESEKPPAGSAELPAKYLLSSFVSHRGPSVHSGHYVAHVHKRGSPQTSDWIFFKYVLPESDLG